jgi:hypothetical protein
VRSISLIKKKITFVSELKKQIVMKTKIKLFFILFASVLCVGFTACSDDDDKTDAAKTIAATYNGPITGNFPIPNASIKLDYVSENKVKVILVDDLLPGHPIECDATVELSTNAAYPNGYEDIIKKGSTTYKIIGSMVLSQIEISPLVPTKYDINVAIVGYVTVISGIKTAMLNIVVGGDITFPPLFPMNLDFIGTNVLAK